jgi:hypothetical protein
MGWPHERKYSALSRYPGGVSVVGWSGSRKKVKTFFQKHSVFRSRLFTEAVFISIIRLHLEGKSKEEI